MSLICQSTLDRPVCLEAVPHYPSTKGTQPRIGLCRPAGWLLVQSHLQVNLKDFWHKAAEGKIQAILPIFIPKTSAIFGWMSMYLTLQVPARLRVRAQPVSDRVRGDVQGQRVPPPRRQPLAEVPQRWALNQNDTDLFHPIYYSIHFHILRYILPTISFNLNFPWATNLAD